MIIYVYIHVYVSLETNTIIWSIPTTFSPSALYHSVTSSIPLPQLVKKMKEQYKFLVIELAKDKELVSFVFKESEDTHCSKPTSLKDNILLFIQIVY